jgi:uncharacterized protein (TIGR02246 family)
VGDVKEVKMSSQSHRFTDQDAAAIREMTAIQVRAVLDHDSSAYLATCTDDVIFIPPEQPAFAGREACRSFLEDFPKPESFTAQVDDVEGDGNLASSRGTATATFADGSSTRLRWLAIFRRGTDGRWRLARDLWNTHDPRR